MKAVNSCRRYPYFDALVGLVWSNDPESCAGGSMPDWSRMMIQRKRGTLVLQCGGWVWG